MHTRHLALVVIVAIIMLIAGYFIGHAITPLQQLITQTTTVTMVTEKTVTHVVTTPLYTTVFTTIPSPIPTSVTTYIPVTTYTTIIRIETVTKLGPISVVDALGRIILFEEKPKRVVSLAPSITEILFALGLGDKIVGVTSYCNYPPDVVKLVEEGRISVIGGYWRPDVEKIIMLKPDLVIGSAGTRPHLDLKERLEGLGIKMVFVKGSNAADDSEIFADISTIASIFGVEDRAVELINSIVDEINYVKKKLAELNIAKSKVLVLLGPPSWGLYSSGGDTFLGWIISTAGGINIAQRFSGWPRLDYEYVLSQDPDVIIITGMGLNPQDIMKDIEGTPLAETKAFKEGKVFIVDQEANDILVRPGPRIGKAVKLMAQILYPEIFGNPEVQIVYRLSSMFLTMSTPAIAEAG